MPISTRSPVLAIFCALFLTTGLKAYASDEFDHKKIVAHAFEQWRQGVGSPFALLTEQATWTIMGPTPSAGTFQRDELTEKVINPFNARLKTPLKPNVKKIFQDGDTVIILFDASAQLTNGADYQNSYAWFFTMKQGRVVAVTAVLDLHAFDEVMRLAE